MNEILTIAKDLGPGGLLVVVLILGLPITILIGTYKLILIVIAKWDKMFDIKDEEVKAERKSSREDREGFKEERKEFLQTLGKIADNNEEGLRLLRDDVKIVRGEVGDLADAHKRTDKKISEITTALNISKKRRLDQ